MALDGVVIVNPSDAGEMWFESKPPVGTSEFVSKHMVSHITLGSNEDYRAFNAPKQQALLSPQCFNASASITASDLQVTLAPAGKASSTLARKIEVNKVERFRKCDPK